MAQSNLGQKDYSIKMLNWSDGYLCIGIVANRSFDSTDNLSLTVEVMRNDELLHNEAFVRCPLQKGRKTLFLTAFSVKDAISNLGPSDCAELSLFVFNEVSDGSASQFRSAVRAKQSSLSGESNSKGLYCDENFIVLPALASDGSFVLWAIGRDAKASRLVFPVGYKECFSTRLVRTALKNGFEEAAAFARALINGSVETKVRFSGNEAMCDCNADDFSSVVRLAGLPESKQLTLLNEGLPLYASYELQAHYEHFDHLLELLIEFDELCNQNDIEYSLAYGSILGAVRHRDFIPWDNDIDLFMTIDNFQKLREVFSSGRQPAGRELEDPWSTPGYTETYARYRDVETTRFTVEQEYRTIGRTGTRGMFLDIFFLIPVSGTKSQVDRRIGRFIAFSETTNVLKRKFGVRSDDFVSEYEAIQEEIEQKGREEVLRSLREEMYVSDPDADFYIPSSSAVAYKEVYKKEWLFPLRKTVLRGKEFPIPNNSQRILREMYGLGFREYPSKRSIPLDRHNFTSVKVPERVVREDYKRIANIAKYQEDHIRLKPQAMENALLARKADRVFTALHTVQLQLRCEAFAANNDLRLEERLEKFDWDDIDKLFKVYYDLLKELKVRRVYLPLAPSFFKAAVFNLLENRNDIVCATKIVDFRLDDGLPLAQEEKDAIEAVEVINEARDCYDRGDTVKAAALVDDVKRKCPYTHLLDDIKMLLKMNEAQGDSALMLAGEASNLQQQHESDGLLLAMAIAYMKSGRRNLAVAYAQWLRQESVDGMTLLELEDIFGGAFDECSAEKNRAIDC